MMNMRFLPRVSWSTLLGMGVLSVMAAAGLQAATIPGLFNTGVDDSGALLGSNQPDLHYALVNSPDSAFPGPETRTLNPGFPVGPWIAEGPASRWIAPQANQGAGNAPGTYTYQTTFDLTGLDPASARITGSLATDDGLNAVRLNGAPLSGITSAGFGQLLAFSIPAGSPFVDGVNTLEFDVSNGGAAANPTGLRVQLSGIANGITDPPSVLVPPASQTVVVGDTVLFSAEVLGTPPLAYQWLFNGDPIQGANDVALSLTGVQAAASGRYALRVSNAAGTTNTAEAVLTVLTPFPGIFNTGVDANRALIADGDVDPHYRLVQNDNDPTSFETFAQTGLPSPPWVPNSVKSRWIGPLGTTTAAGGNYTYQLTLDLTGYDPATAFLAGNWATDDGGALYLNGADTGFRSPGYAAFSFFNLTSGFVSGTNLLEFRVVNGGSNPTGLRVENLRGTAKPGGIVKSPPIVVTQPQGAVRVLTQGVTFTVVADGTAPLAYQWYHDGTAVAGATSSTLNLASLAGADGGNYHVRVSNGLGTVDSARAFLQVIVPQLGVFNTGVDRDGNALQTGQPDPHYLLLASPDASYPGPVTYATAGPIPPWVANDGTSAWISARADASATVAPGNYTYRLVFFIADAVEAGNAALSANFATDDGNGGVYLNGTRVPAGNSGFGGTTALTIPAGSPFVAGLNTLDFVVVNGGAAGNPSGLKVQDIVLDGVAVTRQPALRIDPVAGAWEISWPSAASGYRLQESAEASGPWTDSTLPVAVVDDRNVAGLVPSAVRRFFRLSPAVAAGR